ncbi:hypothetical protein [Streptomyces sp. NPDC001340]
MTAGISDTLALGILCEGDGMYLKRPGSLTCAFIVERVTRIELALSAWEATALVGRHLR